jgi:hypothetical protein
MIIQNAFIKGNCLIGAILLKMSGIGVVQKRFICHLLILIMCIRGKINFLQLERYGSYSERSYRSNFSKQFDWLEFNTIFVKNQCSDELIIGFDPSFISKSGKCTPGLGYFYSGCSSRYEKGLEIGCYSLIDVKQNTAYHLYAAQSKAPTRTDEGRTMMDQYIDQFKSLGEKLKTISTVLVADAYFSKYEYAQVVINQGMELISRFRSDANLRYLHNGPQKSGRGRKKKFAGKVNTKKIDKRRVRHIYEDEQTRIFSLIVNSVNLKMNILLVCVENLDQQGNVKNMQMYFSTNLERDPIQVVEYYKARFQMEFNFRDAKQFTGLTNCQARAKERLDFHFNATLTAINIGKSVARKGIAKDISIPISIRDVKTELSNHLLLNFIFSKFGIDPDLQKNKSCIKEILDFGKIAA